MRMLIGTASAITALAIAGCGPAANEVSIDDDGTAPEGSEATSTEESEPEPESEAGEEEEAPEADESDLAIGTTAELGDYEVTVTEFVEDATERVLGDNQFNEDPENGFYATVTFDATYVGDEEGMPGFDLSAKLVIDGVQHADHECGATVEGGGMDAPTLEHGGTATDITFCFDHPGLNEGARLFFEELISFDGDRVYWSVN